MPALRKPSLEVWNRVAHELPELAEGRPLAERAVAFQRMWVEGEVASGGFGTHEEDEASVLELTCTANDLGRRPACVEVAAIRHAAPLRSRSFG